MFNQLSVNLSPLTDCENLNHPLFSVDLTLYFHSPANSQSNGSPVQAFSPQRCHLRSCAIAQVRNYRREGEAESMKSDSALRTRRISGGCFRRYRARIFLSLSYRTTSASRNAAKVWLTRDKLRPTARAI